jgi:hypothetical protein
MHLTFFKKNMRKLVAVENSNLNLTEPENKDKVEKTKTEEVTKLLEQNPMLSSELANIRKAIDEDWKQMHQEDQ